VNKKHRDAEAAKAAAALVAAKDAEERAALKAQLEAAWARSEKKTSTDGESERAVAARAAMAARSEAARAIHDDMVAHKASAEAAAERRRDAPTPPVKPS